MRLSCSVVFNDSKVVYHGIFTSSNIFQEGKWEWKGIADNLKFDRGEIPNGGDFDNSGGPTSNEDCLEIFNNEGFVNDMDCTFWEFAFVCEAQKRGNSSIPFKH